MFSVWYSWTNADKIWSELKMDYGKYVLTTKRDSFYWTIVPIISDMGAEMHVYL